MLASRGRGTEQRDGMHRDAHRPPLEDESHRRRTGAPRHPFPRRSLGRGCRIEERTAHGHVLPAEVVPGRARRRRRFGLEPETRLGCMLFDREVPARIFFHGIRIAPRVGDVEREERYVAADRAAAERITPVTRQGAHGARPLCLHCSDDGARVACEERRAHEQNDAICVRCAGDVGAEFHSGESCASGSYIACGNDGALRTPASGSPVVRSGTRAPARAAIVRSGSSLAASAARVVVSAAAPPNGTNVAGVGAATWRTVPAIFATAPNRSENVAMSVAFVGSAINGGTLLFVPLSSAGRFGSFANTVG